MISDSPVVAAGPPDLRDRSLPAQVVRQALGLAPHPEGGAYRELWRDSPPDGSRGVGTSILFMLAAGERSHWHRVDAAEIWLWQAGAPLLLSVSDAEGLRSEQRLGPEPGGGEVLQGIIAKGTWQAARSLGAWTVVSCVVAPAFAFTGFELAPPDWSPPGRQRPVRPLRGYSTKRRLVEP